MSLDDRLRDSLHAVSVMDPQNLDDADASLRRRIRRNDVRRHYLQAGIAAVAVVALVLGSVALISRSSSQKNVIEPGPGSVKLSELNGWWVADIAGLADPKPVVVSLQPFGHTGDGTLWLSCGKVGVSWAATTDGQIMASGYSDRPDCLQDRQWPPEAAWLSRVTRLTSDATGWTFLDSSGALVASLRPATAADIPPAARAYWSDRSELDPATKAKSDQPTTVPAGTAAATHDDMLGTWRADGSERAYLSLYGDGTYLSFDGACGRGAGQWIVGAGGELAVMAHPLPTPLAQGDCPALQRTDLATWFGGAASIGFVHGDLQLFDADGNLVHVLHPGGGPTFTESDLECQQRTTSTVDDNGSGTDFATPSEAATAQLLPNESFMLGMTPAGEVSAMIRDANGTQIALIILKQSSNSTWLVARTTRCSA
jgi:hypothetical protein